MNYLGHTLLSPKDPLVLMGNVWGDVLRPRDYSQLDQAVLMGIKIHKEIDSFTDQHKAVDEILSMLRPYQGKYTPVVGDVLMDFILSKWWHTYQTESIETFCAGIYSVITNHLDYIPQNLHPRINRMLSHRWLESCKSRERMEGTLVMLSGRVSFQNEIPQAMFAYDLYQKEMDALFMLFFEDIQQHIRQYIILQNEDLS